MPWSPPVRSKSQRYWLLGTWLLCVWSASGFVRAQNIESILSPGRLIQDHAKLEDDCKQCHVKFDRAAQSGLCADCHKEVSADVKAKTGFHGRQKPQACSVCHTDHKGRDAQVIVFDKKKFDHSQTDYMLRGKHQFVECEKCHVKDKRYSAAPNQCHACHRKDDVHKNSLGSKCADCHNENSWKEARFDHATTRFALSGKHADVKCVACHKDKPATYRDASRNCVGCHKKDDDSSKGHKGLFGEKCEGCHSANHWKPSNFSHDNDTKYLLRGKHRTTSCSSCHSTQLYRVKLSQECHACHAKDDKHKGSLGRDCASCHHERNWRELVKFDHDQSSFPLLGKHAKVECKGCHLSSMFKEAPKDCFACHRKDDKHRGTLGEKCADCHGEHDWKTTKGRFNHDQTKFVLRNAHAAATVKCLACHKDPASMRKTATECVACHKKDDKHEGQLGQACQQCHDDRSWRVEKFDHAATRFTLNGRHLPAPCKSCHLSARFKDAPRDCFSCHIKEDKHKQKFGVQCENCHNTRAWTLWDFDHDKKTNYRLIGKHSKLTCESCHQQAAPKGKITAPLGSQCVNCHRADDVHDGQFGGRCEQCHVNENWKQFKRQSSQLREPWPPATTAQAGFEWLGRVWSQATVQGGFP